MTLHTQIAIHGEIPVQEFAQFVNKDLLKVDVEPHYGPNQIFDHEHFRATCSSPDERDGERREIDDPSGRWDAGNGFGNGFDAAFWVEFYPDRPLQARSLYRDHRSYNPDYPDFDDADEEYEADEPRHEEDYFVRPACYAMVNFDTAYGYQSEQGFGCATLHALYIARIAQWLLQREVGFTWYDEFSGVWHSGDEGPPALNEFIGNGDKATAWFEGQVRPIIEAEAAASGSTVVWGG